ncbi:MAG: tryptophan synthase subunit alpha [Methanothrix sp.]|jgi:tryptophan synthase alpha chain|uniref:tryptophan synthase subunit alpha n=1 Tax=Methanothrix sp. TaxID=90426 RepID=UPI001BD6ABCB|nr:tryptophan synthase subunit alpha [Methanothrix sp.]
MRISEAFKSSPLLIVYLCSGDPSPAATPELVRRVVRAGADIIELGLPHSDPIADGPTIQAAAQRAIAAGMNTDIYFQVAAEVSVPVPKVFMGYYNMVYARGLERFVQDCLLSGITGMIVPDLPPEEAAPLKAACSRHGVDLIYLVASNTPPERQRLLAEETGGFLYLVARPGVTGARNDLLPDTGELIHRMAGDVPKAVGFGISTPGQAAEVIRAGADAVIVGSVCVDLIARGRIEEMESLVAEMKRAVKEAGRERLP